MGAENSRAVARVSETRTALQLGVHYASSDVAVWPHLAPLAQWFTAHDALALRAKLNQRTGSSMLTFTEFVAWLQNGRPPVALHQQTMPIRHDILTPEFLSYSDLAKVVGAAPEDPATTRMLEMYLEHVFHSFKGANSGKVYAVEVLAALVLVSRAIWSFDEKVGVLMELFHDQALSARHTAAVSIGYSASSSERCFKETDVTQLLLCTMRGVAKATVGVGSVWEHHGLNIASIARKLSAVCVNSALEARKQLQPQDSGSPSQHPQAVSSPKRLGRGAHRNFDKHPSTTFILGGISAHEFREFVAHQPVIRRFVALFACEELQNPFTFSPLYSLSTGTALPSSYRSALAKQTILYHSLLQNYVTFEGRDTTRRLSAAVLIQCAWRRRRSRVQLEQHREDRAQQRHTSAAILQRYLRRFQFANVLEQHADAEREAFNGGVFVAGSGPCVPQKLSTDGRAPSATRNHPGLIVSMSPLALVGTFKLLKVRIFSVAVSKNFALAVAEDRQSLFAWGRCLPCVYESSRNASLFQSTPARLAYTFAPYDTDLEEKNSTFIAQVACGLQHALVLTNDGMVHTWGFNDHGQLGHGTAETLEARTNGLATYETYFDERDGRESEYLEEPTRLVYFLGSPAQHADPIPIQQICCGDYYCMALSREGDVFTWGEASEGQLGHGDAHSAFQVAFADRHMLNSAYTFLAQPEPVLALSNVDVMQISCCKNHSTALTRDGRVFEWGSWGKRCGRDMENAFVPVERENVRELHLRQLSVGDHHTLAEGSSVWMKLVTPTLAGDGDVDNGRASLEVHGCPETDDSTDVASKLESSTTDVFGNTKSSFYLACAAYSCSFESIEKFFACSTSGGDQNLVVPTKDSWDCTIVEFDVDDLEDDPEELSEQRTESAGDNEDFSLHHQHEATGDAQSVWRKRVRQFALSVEQVGRFDARVEQLLPLSYRQNRGYSYEKLLNTWLLGHVENRFIAFPRGKPAGFYVQFLVPLAVISHAEVEQRVESEQGDGYVAPAMVEFLVYGSSTAMRTIRKRGFAVHAFHPRMEDAKLTKIQRKKRKHLSIVTEENSLFILEFDASCLPSSVDGLDRQSEDSDDDEAMAASALSELIVSEMRTRVLAAQESGVLAVLIVLDLFNVEPFELQFEDDSGVYIPVLMINRFALATFAYGQDCISRGNKTSLHELLERMLASPQDRSDNEVSSASGAVSPSMHRSVSPRFVSRPMWTARCFRRVDTLSARVNCALANGASGVILIQDSESVEMDGETKGAPVFHRAQTSSDSLAVDDLTSAQPQKRVEDRLIAMISHEEGARLRAASHMTLCQKYMPLLSRDGSNYELVAEVAFEIRPGGTTYAWGCAQNGRLGVGPSPSDIFQHGYEALTDTTYRFLENPTPIVMLAGIEMRQLECGGAHSLAVTAHGKVFAWGRGSGGALAQTKKRKKRGKHRSGPIETTQDQWSPKQVHGLRFENIVRATANDACSLFLTETVSSSMYHVRRREIAQLKSVAKKSLV